ncbi:phosphatase PAP2 family protein [Paraburkholderia xenovorans]|uniref:phosphatase PAP2 family protein n=1 Tax=Paraburkholderia xenovorans TaxID=36873 RepID=UPI0038B6B7F6
MRLLSYITNFGDPYLTSLLAGVVMLWLAATRAWRPLAAWTICFSVGILAVAASRIAHARWGVELPALNFAVISGHSMLASSVYPTTLGICATQAKPRTAVLAYLLGTACAMAISVSRVLMGVHSTAEVVTGWLLGTFIAGITCRLMNQSDVRSYSIRKFSTRDSTPFAALALALIVVCHGKVVAVSSWIDSNAPVVTQWSKVQADETR